VFRGATYRIRVHNPDRVQKGVAELRLDGRVVERVPVCEPGTEHAVDAVMGERPGEGR